jgi:transcriptional regulator with AAA-type ATPase domain
MPLPPTNTGSNLRRLLDSSELVFSAHPQVSHYFPSTSMEDARRRIKRAIDRGDGPALAVGAAGTGKSLLLQVLAAQRCRAPGMRQDLHAASPATNDSV